MAEGRAASATSPPIRSCWKPIATEINKAGGVLGSKIKLVVEDDETNPRRPSALP